MVDNRFTTGNSVSDPRFINVSHRLGRHFNVQGSLYSTICDICVFMIYGAVSDRVGIGISNMCRAIGTVLALFFGFWHYIF